MALALLCLGSRPNTKPAAASPVCLGFQASYSEGSQAGTARQERGLRMPSPLLPASVSVMASWVRTEVGCLLACLPCKRLLLTVAQGRPDPSVSPSSL